MKTGHQPSVRTGLPGQLSPVGNLGVLGQESIGNAVEMGYLDLDVLTAGFEWPEVSDVLPAGETRHGDPIILGRYVHDGHGQIAECLLQTHGKRQQRISPTRQSADVVLVVVGYSDDRVSRSPIASACRKSRTIALLWPRSGMEITFGVRSYGGGAAGWSGAPGVHVRM